MLQTGEFPGLSCSNLGAVALIATSSNLRRQGEGVQRLLELTGRLSNLR